MWFSLILKLGSFDIYEYLHQLVIITNYFTFHTYSHHQMLDIIKDYRLFIVLALIFSLYLVNDNAPEQLNDKSSRVSIKGLFI